MTWLAWLRDFLSVKFKFSYEKKSSLLVIDPKVFKEGEIKEMRVWCWKCMKFVKLVVQGKNGKFLVEYIGCPHMKGEA